MVYWQDGGGHRGEGSQGIILCQTRSLALALGDKALIMKDQMGGSMEPAGGAQNKGPGLDTALRGQVQIWTSSLCGL